MKIQSLILLQSDPPKYLSCSNREHFQSKCFLFSFDKTTEHWMEFKKKKLYIYIGVCLWGFLSGVFWGVLLVLVSQVTEISNYSTKCMYITYISGISMA